MAATQIQVLGKVSGAAVTEALNAFLSSMPSGLDGRILAALAILIARQRGGYCEWRTRTVLRVAGLPSKPATRARAVQVALKHGLRATERGGEKRIVWLRELELSPRLEKLVGYMRDGVPVVPVLSGSTTVVPPECLKWKLMVLGLNPYFPQSPPLSPPPC